jgi:prevent-host-death family protein
MGMQHTVGAFEAKTNFSRLIEEVHSAGAEYIVTRRGEPVAKIIPFRKEGDNTRDDFLEVCREFRKLYRGKPGDFNIKEAIEEGRP